MPSPLADTGPDCPMRRALRLLFSRLEERFFSGEVEVMMGAAAGIECLVAGWTAMSALHVFIDGQFFFAGSAENPPLIPFVTGPYCDGMAS